MSHLWSHTRAARARVPLARPRAERASCARRARSAGREPRRDCMRGGGRQWGRQPKRERSQRRANEREQAGPARERDVFCPLSQLFDNAESCQRTAGKHTHTHTNGRQQPASTDFTCCCCAVLFSHDSHRRRSSLSAALLASCPKCRAWKNSSQKNSIVGNNKEDQTFHSRPLSFVSIRERSRQSDSFRSCINLRETHEST